MLKISTFYTDLNPNARLVFYLKLEQIRGILKDKTLNIKPDCSCLFKTFIKFLSF